MHKYPIAIVGPDGAGKTTFIKNRYHGKVVISLKKNSPSSLELDRKLISVFDNLDSPFLKEIFLISIIYPLEVSRNFITIVRFRDVIFDRAPIDRFALFIEYYLALKEGDWSFRRLLRLSFLSVYVIPNFFLSRLIGTHIFIEEDPKIIYERRQDDYHSLDYAIRKDRSYKIVFYLLKKLRFNVVRQNG